jgi:hypothetical protein
MLLSVAAGTGFAQEAFEMALDEHTGTPPAVTHEKLVAWRRLGEDVTAALAMGGEQALDLLTGLMAEWCEAVEDVNAAREICVNLAAEGRHGEALEWHADGFFEVADLLSTDRAGWDAWETALATRGISVPAMSAPLKQLSDRIHEDLLMQDLAGRTLAQHIDELRVNVLAKGHLGERLFRLEAIRQLDPAGLAWKRMIDPIRRQRAQEIVQELLEAVRGQDFLVINRIEREAHVTRWDDGMPGELHRLLHACAGWQTTRSLRSQLASESTALIARGDALDEVMRQGGVDKLEFNAAYDAARHARKQFVSTYQMFTDALAAAEGEPVVAERLVADDTRGKFKAILNKVQGVMASLDRAKDYWKWLKSFRAQEARVHAHVRKAPSKGGGWEETKARCSQWLVAGGDLSGECRALEASAPIPQPMSYVGAIRGLEAQRTAVKKIKADVERLERFWIMAIIGTILGFLGVVVLVAIVASSWNHP